MISHSPRYSLLFQRVCGIWNSRRNAHARLSGGQNLAALGTTAGQNLAAVGSCHSLTETVDLGTVTLGGLVGTLHSDTPPIKFILCFDSGKPPQQHNIKVRTQSYRCIITENDPQVNDYFSVSAPFWGENFRLVAADSVIGQHHIRLGGHIHGAVGVVDDHAGLAAGGFLDLLHGSHIHRHIDTLTGL